MQALRRQGAQRDVRSQRILNSRGEALPMCLAPLTPPTPIPLDEPHGLVDRRLYPKPDPHAAVCLLVALSRSEQDDSVCAAAMLQDSRSCPMQTAECVGAGAHS